MFRCIPPKLESLLQIYDGYGMPGVNKFSPRSNLLVDDVSKITIQGTDCLQARQMIMEGGSARMFENSCFPGLPDKMNGDHVLIAMEDGISWEGDQKLLLWDVRDAFEVGHAPSVCLRNDDAAWVIDRSTMVLPLKEQLHEDIHVFETFAGGYGGWKVATKVLKNMYDMPIKTVALDESLNACLHYALAHNALLLEIIKCDPKTDLSKIGHDVIIRADADDDAWIPLLAKWRVDLMTISAPCQPWSGAGSSVGLDSDVGCLLPSMILRCRILRPHVVLLEQVNGFSTHRHKNMCLEVLKHVGYQILWQRVLDASEYGGVTRLRWLALAIRRHSTSIESTEFVMWPKIQQLLPDMIKAIFQEHIPDVEQLLVNMKMKTCAMDTCMLPPVMKRCKNSTGSELLQLRTYGENQVLPTFMAMYGTQHELDRTTLERKGYYGHFFSDNHNRLPLLHPAEIQMCHLTYECAFVANDLRQSWLHTGNMITCPHALLLLINGLNKLKNGKAKIDVAGAMDALFQNRLRADQCDRYVSQHGQFFVEHGDVSRDWKQQLQNFDDICTTEHKYRLPEQHAWHPAKGLFLFAEPGNENHDISVSQLTDDQMTMQPETPPATVSFQPVLRAKFLTKQREMDVWIVACVQSQELACQYQGQIEITNCIDCEHGYAFEMKHVVNRNDPQVCATFATACIHEGFMIFLTMNGQEDIPTQLAKFGLQELQFDQFGILDAGQQFTHCTMLADFRIQHAKLPQHACMIFAAFQQIRISFLWDVEKMRNVFAIDGNDIAVRTTADFWAQVLEEKSMSKLNVSLLRIYEDQQLKIAFCQNHPLPPDAFATLLAIMATRQILDALSEDNQIRVVLKWNSKTIWDGSLSPNMNLITISSILQMTMFPILLGKSMRLIHKAKQCCDVLVGQLFAESTRPFLMLKMIPECSGGVGSKESQKAYARNSLASTLLEQGFALEWVSQATDTLVNNAGLKQAIQISQLPPGKQRIDEILKLCENSGMSPPPQMSKAANKVAQTGSHKARKRAVVQINPAKYTIEGSFFIGQDGEPLPQIPGIRHKSTGIALMTMDQAIPWIHEQQVISTDELAMVIPGHHEHLQTNLKHEILHVPCKDNDSRPVIIKATVIQLGEKLVRTHVSSQPVIEEQVCRTVAITLWQEDWTKEDWGYIVDHPFAFARQALSAQGCDQILQSTWGRSLRRDRQPTTAQHATSVQFHATVPNDRFNELLTLSGFNKLWVTPKDHEGRLDTSWRIIWTEGSLAHLSSLASKTKGCAGMVKNKKSMGLRYAKGDYDQAWAVIFPDREIPKAHDMQHMFQLQSLPYGCSASMLEQWSQNNKWNFKAVKALGPNAWLIGSAEMPPQGIHMFNSKPILIKYLPPKDVAARSPIVAGPQPRRTEKATSSISNTEHSGASFDPWAGYNQHKLMQSQARQQKELPGPTEARFQEHATKLNDHGEQLARMEKALTQLKQDTQQEFQNVANREKQLQTQVQTAITSVKSELETSFQNAINKQSTQLNDTLGELRQLLQTSTKRVRTPEENDMQD